MVSTFVGFTIMMVVLMFAAQVLVRLYVASVLSATATHAAEQAAFSSDPASAVGPAEADARTAMGRFGAERTSFHWIEADDRWVVLRVSGRSPVFLPWPEEWTQISRTVRVRTERFR